MARRIIAVLGTLALAVTIVPSGLDAISLALDCCNGIMCPMHAEQRQAANCDMGTNGSSAALKPCPVQAAAHYTAAIIFVLLAPLILHDDARSEPAIAFLSNFLPNVERRVESPPPRLPVTA
ncbi:MAG: hypothetical protein DMG32_10295 [Acidobacteria bacterium]|nr:MAG: hypothetical protein DMG32_10295 [Acidobacteriota bacterium]